MTPSTTDDRRQLVVDILEEIVEETAHGNDLQYIWASDVASEDPELSGSMVGTYLSDIESDSPLSNGLEVEQYTKKRGGPSLWTVRRRSPS